jgi:hypothetical protein
VKNEGNHKVAEEGIEPGPESGQVQGPAVIENRRRAGKRHNVHNLLLAKWLPVKQRNEQAKRSQGDAVATR